MVEGATSSEPTSSASEPRIEVVDADAATLSLLREWLGAAGYRVADGRPHSPTQPPPALTIVDVPFLRQGAAEHLRRIGDGRPGTPLLALSPMFFSNVRCDGDCARKLGVAGVLPKPLTREALLGAVDRILDPAR